MLYSKHVLLSFAAVVLAACGAMDRQINKGYAAQALDFSTSHATTLRANIDSKVPEARACFADSKREVRADTDCVVRRNQVVSLLMSESIFLCTEHLNSIYGHEAAFNIATGSISALASGFAAISTSSRAATLSALSAFATSERSLINENVYKNMLTAAIGTKISQLREQKGNALLKRKTESLQTFGLEDAIQDVLSFHESCSFRVGLQVALAEGTQSTSDSKRAQLEARASQLMNQVNAYAAVKKLEPAAYALDSNGTTKAINDPFVRSLIDQYLAVSRGIQNLLPESGSIPGTLSAHPTTQDPPPASVPRAEQNSALPAVSPPPPTSSKQSP